MPEQSLPRTLSILALRVEYRPGGGAVIATEAIARATPDGYTLGLLGSTREGFGVGAVVAH